LAQDSGVIRGAHLPQEQPVQDQIETEDGRQFRLLGRSDDMISSAGYRIGPTEVENALIEHPAVTESAVVACPDSERGEIVKAFVVLHPDYMPSEALVKTLQQHVQQHTAPYKYPRRIEFVASLPKNPSGKIMRRVLRDQEFNRSHGNTT
jgi:acyl-coenzyme A synthetase/AMP-(fatty) acid ligase